jgi:hypothetical protein
MQRQFSQLEGERMGDHYQLYGLPEDADFRDEESYVGFQATWLKVNDVAFAASSFEFGEHQHTIEVEQSTEGGGANIKL